MSSRPPFKVLPLKGPDVSVEYRNDGAILIYSNLPPGLRPHSIPHCLDERAAAHPDRPWIRQRPPDFGPWRTLTYGDGASLSGAAAESLADLGLGPERPLMILSGNSIEHAVVSMAAMKIAAPAAPISPPFSLLSKDHAKLRHCCEIVRPRAVFVQSHRQFADALAVLPKDITVISADDEPPRNVVRYRDLVKGPAGARVTAAMAALSDNTDAKFLFTSGSTGNPKAAIQTQGMMCAQIAARDGIRGEERDNTIAPQILDWMPWSHTSGGTIGFNDLIWIGGTLYLDDGRPVPGLFDLTINNLYEVSPDLFGTAPVAYAMLVDAMERDPKLRCSFFRNLTYLLYGGASLPDDLYTRLQTLAVAETGSRIPMLTMYGSTETLGITQVHWIAERVGLVGLPLPGITLKLVPTGSKYEIRAKGPTVTKGYVRDLEKTRAAFDDEGFYKLGDGVRFVEPSEPKLGLAFDGRVTEDFKLVTGTWVSVGTLRPDLVAACSPLVSDAVIAGQDKSFVGALLWLSQSAMQQWTVDAGARRRIRNELREKLATFNANHSGSSRRVTRALVLTTPPSVDGGEITDKGYVNQLKALELRASEAASLFQAAPGPDVIVA